MFQFLGKITMDMLMLVFCAEMMNNRIERQPFQMMFRKHGIHLFTPGLYGHHISENNSID